MKNTLLFTTLLTLLFFPASCSKKDNDNPQTGDPDTPTSGYVKGKVVDTKGQPIRGASIIIDNTLLTNSYLTGTTNDKGEYSIKLYASTWQAYAEMNVTYNGQTYKIDLHPDNTEGFSQQGAVRNFQWKLTGKKPLPLQGYYDATITIQETPASLLFDRENIEWTFTPVGPLIDGSQGQTIVTKCGAPFTDDYGKIRVPIGRYNVSAKHLPTGTQLKLGKTSSISEPLATTIQIDIIPYDGDLGPNSAFIKYTEKDR